MLATVLESLGATVEAVGSVSEALTAFRQRRPDIVVSDIGMPDEDGYALIRAIRALPPEEGGRVPALALTAYARLEDRTQALAAGFSGHVAKPVEPTELALLAANLGGRFGSS
jgi:CheY-like chemotaxis protein